MTEASDAATSLGLPDPAQSYRVRRIGQWANDTFQTGPSQSVTWPVSRFITGPGPLRGGVSLRRSGLVRGGDPASPSGRRRQGRRSPGGAGPRRTPRRIAKPVEAEHVSIGTEDLRSQAALFRRRRPGGHSFNQPDRSFRFCRLCHREKVQRTSRKCPSPVIVAAIAISCLRINKRQSHGRRNPRHR